MAKVTVGYFLEDIGQQAFLKAVVTRVFAERTGLSDEMIRHDVRNATGGKGTAMTELRRFLRDVRNERESSFDILVVAIDSNCKSYTRKRNEIEKIVQQTGYQGNLVYAIPAPHVERWYLIDASGFQQAIATSSTPQVPAYKCERKRYKQALSEAFASAGIITRLGGIEYAADIVKAMDFYKAGREDASFKYFVDSLQTALEPFTRTDE